MCLQVVTLATNGHEIRSVSSQRIIHSIEWHDVVNISSNCVVAYLADWILLSNHSTDLHPLPVVATINTVASELFTLLLTFLRSE